MLVFLAMGRGLQSREENLGLLIEAGYKQWGVVWGECHSHFKVSSIMAIFFLKKKIFFICVYVYVCVFPS